MRRTEQVRFHQLVGLVCIGQIIYRQIFEAADVVERMVADAVSAFHYHTEHIRMLADVVAYHEKSSLDVVFVQGGCSINIFFGYRLLMDFHASYVNVI